MKRALKIAGITIAVLAVLLVGAGLLAYLLVDLDKVVNEQVAGIKPQVEEKLGRKVELGKISTRFFPTLGGRVEAIAIAPDPAHPEDDRPMLRIGAVGFDLSLLKVLLSGGKEIEFTSIYLDGLAVNLVRYPDGRLSYQDILDRQPPAAEEAEEPEESDEALSPEVRKYLAGLSIGEVRLKDAEVRLVDLATPTGAPAESHIRQLNLRLRNVRLTDAIRIHLSAAIFSEQTNFELETSVGPLPADLQLQGAPPLGFVKLRVTDVDLSRLTPYLPASPAKVDSALISASYDVGALTTGKPLDIAGFLAVKDVQLGGGKKFDVRMDSKLSVDLEGMGANIEKLEVAIGSVRLAMAGSLLDLGGTPRFQDFTLRSNTLDPSALLSYYPAGRESLPPGLALKGAASLDVKASGDATRQSVQAALDFGAMDILLPEQFIKPTGTPLALRLDGEFTAEDANLEKLEFVLDELALTAAGTVKNFEAPVLDLKLGARPFSFDRLVRLLPSANQALAASQASASGSGSLQGHLKGTASNLDALFELALNGVKLDVPGTRLDGDLRLKLAAQGDPAKDLKASLLMDANQAVIDVEGQVHKTASTPAIIDLAIARAGQRIDVSRFTLRFAELAMTATGGFDLASGSTDLKVSMDRLDLEKFARTVTAIPASMAKDGFIDAKLAVRGNPNDLDSMEVVLNPLNARLGRSDLRGELKVVKLTRPMIEMKIGSNRLDVDQLLPSEPEPAAAEAQVAQAPAEDNPALKDLRFTGTFDLKRIIVSEVELQNFRGDVRLGEGVLRLEDCTFNVFGGVVTAKGTEAEIWKGQMPFKANLSVKGLDVNQAMTAKTRFGDTLHGKGDFAVALSGVGFETAQLEKHLTGSLGAALVSGRLAKANLTQSVVGDLSLLEKIPGANLGAVKSDSTFKDLAGQFRVSDGKLNLERPLSMNVDGNPVVVTGAIGIAGGLFLQGDYTLSASMVNRLTGGKCSSTEAMVIPIAIGGTVTSPELKPNAKAVAGKLVERCLKDGIAGAAQKVLGDKAAGVVEKVSAGGAEARQKAQQEADKARAEAEAKIAAEKARVEQARLAAEQKAREEAERQKKAAEDKLKEKAGGLLKGFGK